MSQHNGRSNGRDLPPLLQPPPDLHLMGFVFVQPEHHSPKPAATVTVWGAPDDPRTLEQVHYQETLGREPGALFLVFSSRLEVDIQPQWRKIGWFKQYVDDLAREIQRSGPEQFFEGMFRASTPVTTG